MNQNDIIMARMHHLAASGASEERVRAFWASLSEDEQQYVRDTFNSLARRIAEFVDSLPPETIQAIEEYRRQNPR